MPTLQSVALTVLEILATITPKNLGSRDLGYSTPPFQKFVTRCVWTVTGNVQVKNEVRISNTTDRMCHNMRGVKLTPASRRRYKIGLPVEGLKGFCSDGPYEYTCQI